MNQDDPRDRALEELIRRQGVPPEAPADAACLDADRLAAWADGALTGADLAAVETHAADCARCQALFATMVRTSPVEEPVGLRWRGKRFFPWVAPLAAAAVLILMVSILRHGWQEPQTPAAQIAQQRAAPAAPASSPVPQPSDRSLPAEPATRQAETPKPESRQERRARVAAAPPAVAPPAAVGGVASNERRADAAARPSAAEAVAVVPPPPPQPAPPGLAGAGAAQAAVTKRAFASVPLEVTSADRSVRWRTSGGSSIERSGDGGVTWMPLPLASPVVFAAGASPSPDVCWLVGPAGTVFLATDGRTFRRLRFPETANLMTIRATDARSATVTTADGRRFVTADGGETWTLQETPAAPF